MKKIALVLSGCGVKDGSEIHETVLTMLAITRARAQYFCFAPSIIQTKVVDHYNDKETDEKRSVLIEAARIARGQIRDIKEANAQELDAVIFPGGFGAVSNLSDFSTKKAQLTVQSDVLRFAKDMASRKKPAGFICIAPHLIPVIYGPGVELTIGNDLNTARVLESMGGIHRNCTVDNIVVDTSHKVVSTPAYMLGPSIADIAKGIEKLVEKVIELS